MWRGLSEHPAEGSEPPQPTGGLALGAHSGTSWRRLLRLRGVGRAAQARQPGFGRSGEGLRAPGVQGSGASVVPAPLAHSHTKSLAGVHDFTLNSSCTDLLGGAQTPLTPGRGQRGQSGARKVPSGNRGLRQVSPTAPPPPWRMWGGRGGAAAVPRRGAKVGGGGRARLSK